MKSLSRPYRISLAFPSILLLVIFVLPNVFNSRELAAFSAKERLNEAREKYRIEMLGDSVEVVPGAFYKRGFIIKFLLGSANRELWQQKVKAPVMNVKSLKLTPIGISGRKQSIGIKLKDSSGRIWKVRSVNKDQATAVPPFLRSTILRPMFRDQACALNPYAAFVVAKLAPAIAIHFDDPQLYFFPYDESLGKYNERMAGRLVSIIPAREEGEIVLNGEKATVLSTADLLQHHSRVPLDTSLYLRTRLFDILISDWDRHGENWKWILKVKNGKQIVEPVAEDRDIAFYNFGNGVMNKFTLLFVSLFASYSPDYKDMKALMQESAMLDIRFLKAQKKEQFLKEAAFIKKQFNPTLIHKAFKVYPPNVYHLAGKEHEKIFELRLKKLDYAASRFHDLIQTWEVN